MRAGQPNGEAETNVLSRLTLSSAKARRGLARGDEIQPSLKTFAFTLLHVLKNIGHGHVHKSTPLGLMLFSGFPNVCNCVFIAQGFRKLLGLFSVSYIEMQMSFLLSNICRSR